MKLFQKHEVVVARCAAIIGGSNFTAGRVQAGRYPTILHGLNDAILIVDDKRIVPDASEGFETKFAPVLPGKVKARKRVVSRGNAVREKLEPYVVKDGARHRTVMLPRDLKKSFEKLDRFSDALSGNVGGGIFHANDNLALQKRSTLMFALPQQYEPDVEETSVPLAAALVVSSFAGFLIGGSFFMLGGSWRLTLGAYFAVALLPAIALIIGRFPPKDPTLTDKRTGKSTCKNDACIDWDAPIICSGVEK